MKNMISKMKQLYSKYREIINYLIFGVLTTIVALFVKFILLFTILEASNGFQLQVAVVLSWISAVLFAYFTNRKYVFESNNKNKLREFVNFIIARLVTLFLDMFIMWFFVTLLKLNTDLYVLIFILLFLFFSIFIQN